MKVLKFGGTSVGSAARIKSVAKLVNNGEKNVVVLSAMSGTTNALVEIANYLYKDNKEAANEQIAKLLVRYSNEIEELYTTDEAKQQAKDLIKSHFNHIKSFTKDMFTLHEEKAILAQGELLSTAMFHYYLNEQGIKSCLLPALDFMRTDKNNEPDNVYIKEHVNKLISKQDSDNTIFITQGFICRNEFGEIDNLQRGGSDYTASLIGAAIHADEIQIWTDIDGMHNNDPRYVENTYSIANLSFDEAAELAYFGAKILHPTSVLPAKLNNIPVRLLNTMSPEAHGTLISSKQEKKSIKAIAAKDNITAIKIKSGHMLLAYGFMRKVFEIFESFETPIDMITTSEVGVSVSIDDNRNLHNIVDELKKFGTVEVCTDQSIICVVGDLISSTKGYASKIFEAMADIPIRMISYGGSNFNVSILVASENKVKALNDLNDKLFN